MSAFNTATERAASPIGALYPYLQHRSPACTESCVCGAREAIKAVEQAINAERGFTHAEFCRFVQEAREQCERAEQAEQGVRDLIEAINRIDDTFGIDAPVRLTIDRELWVRLLHTTADVLFATGIQREPLAAASTAEAPASSAGRDGEFIAGASGFAAQALRESYDAGHEISVPSLGLKFRKKPDEPPTDARPGDGSES